MRFYRFKVKFWDNGELVTEHGLTSARSYAEAANQVTRAFTGEDEVDFLKLELFYPIDCGDVMTVSEEHLDAIAKEVIW